MSKCSPEYRPKFGEWLFDGITIFILHKQCFFKIIAYRNRTS